jgi:hypothetical protein
LASNLKRSKRTVGKRLTDIQSRVSTIEKRPAAKSLASAAVSTTNLAPGAVGGWMIDSDAIYTGVKTNSGSYAPAGSVTISSDGHISANKFRIDSNGDAFFSGSLSAATGTFSGALDIGGPDALSFHVDTDGNMWIGNTTFNTSTFSVTSGGVLKATAGSIAGWDISSTKFSKTNGYNYIELVPALSNATTSAIKIKYDDGSTQIQSTLAAQLMYLTYVNGATHANTAVDYTGIYIDQGGTDNSYLNFYGARVNGIVTVPNNQTIRAETSFILTNSTTTARLTQGDHPGFDYLARPSSLRELKENIEDIEDALGILSALRPRVYNFRVDAFSPIDPYTQEPWTEEAREIAQLDIKYGLIVDEVMSARPELISYSHERTDVDPAAEGGYFDFSSWRPTMWEDADVLVLCIKAIQELAMRIADLESKS